MGNPIDRELGLSSPLHVQPPRAETPEAPCETRRHQGKEYVFRRCLRPGYIQRRLERCQLEKEKEGRAQAFENERVIVRPPNVVENSPFIPKLETYPALIIGKNINRVLVILSRLGMACRPICGRKRRRTFIEVGILRESKTFLVLEMAEAPKNV